MAVAGFQQKAQTKGYYDNESTSREERIDTNKLSILPSLPEKTEESQHAQFSLNSPAELFWAFSKRYFGVLIENKCYHLQERGICQ